MILGEDNALLREGMRGMLSAVDDLDLVATCADLPTLVEKIDELNPDVVLTDIRMPPKWIDEGVQWLGTAAPTIPRRPWCCSASTSIRATSARSSDSGSAGRGYLLKERVADLDQLLDAVRTVASGGSASTRR